ncbi:MAG: T9SS type A sorting domain-containing protein [Ignavibacteriales bacterium]|nr:T9SS type A sorting domain-containing protein [Ignavibacteriales bacterium]
MQKICVTLLLALTIVAQAQQITIQRIEAMPSFPQPYLMRDWKQVAKGYDSLVFNQSAAGQYLPLIFLNSQGINYPAHGFLGLHTYVGTNNTNATEAINVLPAIVGASLSGINKRNQNGKDFVLQAEDYFNKRPQENVYLNSQVASSGDDWWYETMPNIYFYQMQALYPHVGDFDFQFTSVAERWTQAVNAMGASATPWKLPDMRYRAWNLSTMTPLIGGVIEPEAAGAIGWILNRAFMQTGNKKYRIAAEQSLEFLHNLSSNPSYELQLPYGIAAAAQMNAMHGTNYNIEKMMNWAFETGPLRNWGTFTGVWGGFDVAGLIGEQGSNGYAFIMNGFQQAGALLPVARYDERYARALGKWGLNLANASRLFYANYLPDDKQDGRAWSSVYDPQSYIAHEALRQESNGKTPFATGDAVQGGWAQTNFSLYSSSSVGYLAAMLDTTNVSGILRFDLLKTDFLKQESYPTYLYYNPYQVDKQVTMQLPTGSFKIYNAVSNTVLLPSASGAVTITVPADNAVIAVLLPLDGTMTYNLDKMLVNGIVADFNSGHFTGNYPPRIKSLTPTKLTAIQGEQISIYCTAYDKEGDNLTYVWNPGHGTVTGAAGTVFWKASQQTGMDTIVCMVKDIHNNSASDTLILQIVERINHAPLINFLKTLPGKTDIGKQIKALCDAYDEDGDALHFTWKFNGAAITQDTSQISFAAPTAAGNYYLSCTVADGFGGLVTDSTVLIVRDFSSTLTGQLCAWYPCNGNGLDNSGNGNNAFAFSVQAVPNRHGIQNSALSFNGTSSYMQVLNTPFLNFQNTITLNFWITPKYFYDREQYPVSHGNWERRWKVSITNKKIRWTLKTANGIKDVDSRTTLQVDSTYNVTALYDGLGMELYINGVLEAAIPHSGAILTTDYDLTIGEVVPGNSTYNFNGVLDEIRLYNCVLLPDSIAKLSDIVTGIDQSRDAALITAFGISTYPNPCNAATTIRFDYPEGVMLNLELKDILGRTIQTLYNDRVIAAKQELHVDLSPLASGVYFLAARSNNTMHINKLIILK